VTHRGSAQFWVRATAAKPRATYSAHTALPLPASAERREEALAPASSNAALSAWVLGLGAQSFVYGGITSSCQKEEEKNQLGSSSAVLLAYQICS
jgi:hypothetical protein